MRGRCSDFDHAAAAKAPAPFTSARSAQSARSARSPGQADPRSDQHDSRLHPAGEALLALQRTYGNRFVQRAVLQAKLVVGPAGDRYEREADRVAQAVVRGTAGPKARDIQPIGGAPAGTEPGDAMQAQIRTSSVGGRGRRIPGQVRAPLEETLGADLSGVRVHDDTQADQFNRALRANALTTGSDIFFRRGTYAPGSRAGDALLTHELVHVLQQRGTPGPTDVVQLNRPEDYRDYAEAKKANKYSRRLLDTQKNDTLALHVDQPFTKGERRNIYRVNKGKTGQITSDTDGSNLYLQDTKLTPHVDHRFPKSKGGSNSYANAAVLPANLNIQKSDKLELDQEPTRALPPYRKLVDPAHGVMRGKDFSADQKRAIYAANIIHYQEGNIVSDENGSTILEPHDISEVPNVDHITPKSAGGSSFYFNAMVVSAQSNIQKGGVRGGMGGEDYYDHVELNMTLAEYYDHKTTGALPGFLDVPTSPTASDDERFKKKRRHSTVGSTNKSSGRDRSASTGSKPITPKKKKKKTK